MNTYHLAYLKMRQKKMNDHYVFKFIDIEIFTFCPVAVSIVVLNR
jgi:hypothetical protein